MPMLKDQSLLENKFEKIYGIDTCPNPQKHHTHMDNSQMF